LLQSTTTAPSKCAKVNIFRNHDLEKMFGHRQSCSPARLDTGWFWNNIANRSKGFPHQSCEKIKGYTSFMALARIITRSHLCSRELALDLIARGYAVEIVSPDSIPDNLADLELRVEEDPGNQLVASVEAHNGERRASLEFVHYLKAPMPDFIRRPPPEPHEAVHFPEPPVSFNAEKSAEDSAEDVELGADAPQPAPETVSLAPEIPRDAKLYPELAPKPDSEEGAPLFLSPDPLPSPPADPPNHSASASSMIARPIVARPIARPVAARPVTTAPTTTLPRDVRTPWPQPFDQSSGPFRNVALTLASMVLLMALGLGFSMRRGNKASAPSSGAASAGSIATAPIIPGKDTGKHQGQVSALPVSPAATKPEAHPDNAPQQSPGATINNPAAKAPTAAPTPTEIPTKTVGTKVSGGHGDGLIARDTVTYFDQRSFDKAASSRQPISGKRDGVIAENTVTVLNNNPTPKAAKPDSAIKPYSDLK
jgi:hypothetical protein